MKLTKYADPDKYIYSGYAIKFDARSHFSLSNGERGKNVVIFGINNSFCMHTDNRKKDILAIVEGLADGLDYAPITAEAKYSTNFTKSRKKFCINLHHMGKTVFCMLIE